MCAILDANVVSEVFDPGRSEAGTEFFEWLSSKRKNGVLVVGGQLRAELLQSSSFRKWAYGAQLAGRVQFEDDQAVHRRADQIKRQGACSSDDEHVIALAQVSGARLLFTNDRELQKDFRKKALIDNPRGRVYSTLKSRNFTRVQRELLANKQLCGSKQA